MARHRAAILWIAGFLSFAALITLNLDFSWFMRYFLLGLPFGAMLALIAVGYTMVYGIVQLINFAHGEVFMLSSYFMVMLLSPGRGEQVGRVTASVAIAFITGCTARVVFGRLSPLSRYSLASAIGAAIGILNYLLILAWGKSSVLSLALAAPLGIFFTCCLGITMDLVAYKPLRNAPRLIGLITAIGLSLFLANFAQFVWGSQAINLPSAAHPSFLRGPESRIQLGGGMSISNLDVFIVVLALFAMVAVQLFIHRTRAGKAMRACAEDRNTAGLMGIRSDSMIALAFALGAGLAAVVSPLYVMRGSSITPTMGYIVGILAFSSAVLGGIGNITGAMLGGLIIGMVYSFVPLFNELPNFKWFKLAENAGWVSGEGYRSLVQSYGAPGMYQLGVAYMFMIMVIVLKPTGLLGRTSARRA